MSDINGGTNEHEDALTEIGAALADIAEILEKKKQEPAEKGGSEALVKALVDGLGRLKISAPAVTFNTPKGQDWTSLHVKVSKPAADGSKEYVITKK